MAEGKETACRCVWVCVCGPPACGKTTLCRALLAHPTPGLCVAHVEFDALLHARTAAAAADTLTPALWRACRTALLDAAEAASARVSHEAAAASAEEHAHAHAHMRGVVLLDDNFPLASMRLAVARRAHRCGCAFATLWLVQDAALAAARNAARPARTRVAPPVAARLARTAEAPRPARHAWERAARTLDAAALPHAAAQARAVAAWLAALPLAPVVLVDPAKEGQPKPKPTPNGQQEQQPPEGVVFDLWMRRTVGAVLAATEPAARPAVARQVAALRRAALRPGRGSGMSVAQAQAAFVAALQRAQLMVPAPSDGDGDGDGDASGDGSGCAMSAS